MNHGHGHGHAAGRASDRRRLRQVLVVTSTVLVVELVGAWLTGSLALLADAGHMATDAGAVVLALGASYVAGLRPGPRSTFGLHRAEILAALLNALVLLVVCGYLAWAGLSRLADPQEVEAGPMIAFATVGEPAHQFVDEHAHVGLHRLEHRRAEGAGDGELGRCAGCLSPP